MGRALRIIVADADSKNAGLLAYGFEREGITPVVAHAAADVGALVAGGAIDAIVLSLGSTGLLTNAVTALRGMAGASELPILTLGDAAARTGVLAAGASEFLARPAYVRDVVSLTRLLALARTPKPTGFVAELAEFASGMYVLRALCETRRSGVLSVECAGRRAELKLCDGTVATAQLGTASGMDALRRLSLWQQGHVEMRLQPVPRSGQIGLELPALVEGIGQFLRAIYELAPDAAGAALFEKDIRKVAEIGGDLTPSAGLVLRAHDGRKRLWEVIADVPSDAVETVAHTRRLVELGLLLAGRGARSKTEAPGALASSDWLIGAAQPVSVPSLVGYGDVNEPSQNVPRIRPTPVPPEALISDAPTPSMEAVPEIQTAPVLAPRGGARFAPVVPSQSHSGEIGAQPAPAATFTTPTQSIQVTVAVHAPPTPVPHTAKSMRSVALPPPVLPTVQHDEPTDPDAPAVGEDGSAPRAKSADGTVSGQLTARKEAQPAAPVMASIVVREDEPAVVIDNSLRPRRSSAPPPAQSRGGQGSQLDLATRATVPVPIVPAPVVPAGSEAPAPRKRRQSESDVLSARAASQPVMLAAPPAGAMTTGTRPARTSEPGVPARNPSNPELIAQVQKTAGDAARAASRALTFDALDEKFFKEGVALATAAPPPLENFDDLDEGGQTEESPRPGFWRRPDDKSGKNNKGKKR